MTNKKVLDIVLAMARQLGATLQTDDNGRITADGAGAEEVEALAQMEDYYNDVLED